MFVFFKRLIMNILYLLSFISIRNKRIWVFGSYGNFNDNSRYLFLSMQDKALIKSIWIAKNRSELIEVKKYNKNCYLRYSIKGLYYCLRAKVYIYSAYVSDINYFTSGNSLRINLWHGVPLKKIEFDIKNGDISHIFNNSIKSKFFQPWVYIGHTYVLSPSQFVADYSFKKAFRLSQDKILINEYPRVRALMDLKNKYINKNNQYTFLYAPTWRDHNFGFLNDASMNWGELNEFCKKKNAKILVKLHNNSKKLIVNKEYNYIEILDNSIDSNHLMVMADCLITDYSSIYFDYLHLDKPILLYRFDEIEYREYSREFYSDIYEYKPGLVQKNFKDLLRDMEICIENPRKVVELAIPLKNKMNLSSTQLTYHVIENVLFK